MRLQRHLLWNKTCLRKDADKRLQRYLSDGMRMQTLTALDRATGRRLTHLDLKLRWHVIELFDAEDSPNA